MASNTLLAGELARRNKEIEPINNNEAIDYNTSTQNGETNQPKNNNGSGSEWKMVLYQSPQQQPNVCGVEPLDQKSMNSGNYRNASFSMALQDLIGIDSVNSSQSLVDESAGKLQGTHFSNPSSLVTSLSSSREDSPDKTGPTMFFARPPSASKFISPSASVSTWFPSAAGQLRPAAISLAHLPVFAAWSDT